MKLIIALISLVCLMASNADCEETLWQNADSSISTGLALMQGDTTYQIGGEVKSADNESGTLRFPISELIFPLDVYIATFNGKFQLNENWKLAGGIKKNISTESGKMEDSDWGIRYSEDPSWTDPDSLDIYSKSDANVDLVIAEIGIRYYFSRKTYKHSEILFFVGGKYIYHNFDFDISNGDQWYPSQPDEPHTYLYGKVLTYEVTKHIPAATIGIELLSREKLSFDAYFGYSPFVTVDDKDHHLLRSKIMKAECDGDATLLSLSGSYNFRRQWTIDLRFDYISIDTKGHQKQYRDGDYLATIEQKNFSEITTYGLSVSYSF
jgi:hypothetical protein